MMLRNILSPGKRMASFNNAARGLKVFLLSEPHAWVHLGASVVVGAGILYMPLEKWELVALLVCVGMVWAAEMFNTCLEKAMDLVHPEKHPLVRNIKDMAAGAVLVLSIVALAIGLLIFIPKLSGTWIS